MTAVQDTSPTATPTLTSGEAARALVHRARAVFGGGTLHSWAIPEDATVVIARGLGSHVWDADGREYIDCHLGSGPLLLGHGHPGVTAAVKAQLDRGVTFHFFNPQVIEFAERVVAAVPCAEAGGAGGGGGRCSGRRSPGRRGGRPRS